MTLEVYTETFGQRGSVLNRITGTGVNQPVVSNVPTQKSITHRVDKVRRHKPAGWLYPTAYERTLSVMDRGNGVHQRERVPPTTSGGLYQTYLEVGLIDEIAGLLQQAPCEMPQPSDSMKNRALIEALLKLKNQQVNLAQAYAERKMTADLLASSLTRMARSLKHLRRRNLKAAWRELGGNPRKLPQSWLEYQYGWTPLLNDIHGSVTALQGRKELDDWVVTVKGNVTEVFPNSEEFLQNGEWPCRRRISGMRGYFTRLDYTPDNGFLAILSSLGLTNPALLAWELLPYSFVIDWATPIGDWLSSLDAGLGFQFRSGSTTLRRERFSHVKALTGPVASNPYKVVRADYECSRREFSLIREVHSSSPLPGFPGFKDPFSLGHVANGLSLLSQALAGGPVRVR